VLYGAIVGALYGTPCHQPQERMTVTWHELFPTDKRGI
jgi:hypothetical protein